MFIHSASAGTQPPGRQRRGRRQRLSWGVHGPAPGAAAAVGQDMASRPQERQTHTANLSARHEPCAPLRVENYFFKEMIFLLNQCKLCLVTPLTFSLASAVSFSEVGGALCAGRGGNQLHTPRVAGAVSAGPRPPGWAWPRWRKPRLGSGSSVLGWVLWSPRPWEGGFRPVGPFWHLPLSWSVPPALAGCRAGGPRTLQGACHWTSLRELSRKTQQQLLSLIGPRHVTWSRPAAREAGECLL